MWFWIIIIVVVVAVVIHLNSEAKFANSCVILGMRMPKNKYDSFEDKGCNQFREECRKNSIDVDYRNMPNLCTYLRILERKGLHLELIKDSTVRYKNKEGEYLGSDTWQDKWTRIIFSPHISGEEFCECIRIIMTAHNFSEYKNKKLFDFKGNDGMIKAKDSFFIYRALYIMRYNIFIKKNDTSLKDYEIVNPIVLVERGKPTTVFCYPKNEECHEKKMASIANIKLGRKIPESKIVTEGNYDGIIYLENIKTGTCEFMYRSFNVTNLKISEGCIIIGQKFPFDINIWNKAGVIAENVLAVDVKDISVSVEYLFLYLKLMFLKLKDNRADELSESALNNTNIIIVPKHIQREIIKKGMPVKDDAELLEAVFSSYNESYPMLRLVSK